MFYGPAINAFRISRIQKAPRIGAGKAGKSREIQEQTFSAIRSYLMPEGSTEKIPAELPLYEADVNSHQKGKF